MKQISSVAWAVSLSLIMISSGFVMVVGSGTPEPIELPEPTNVTPPEPAALFNPWPTYTGNTLYHTIEEMEAEIFQAAIDHSDIMTVESIGKTWQDRDIWAIKISDNPQIEEADEPEVYFNCAHHSREWLTIEIGLYSMHFLTDNYGINATVTDIVDNRQVWIIPSVNPDGRVFDGNVLGDDPTAFYGENFGGYGWRRNCRDNNGDEVFDPAVDGVDLNRNYGFLWGASGASADPTYDTYGGIGPFSEPESQAVRDFARQHNFVFAISYHTYSQLILYPWGWSFLEAPDNDALLGAANAMADKITNLAESSHDRYDPTKSSGLYPTAGSDDDWLYAEFNTFAYCVEAFPYYDWINGTGMENHPLVESPNHIFHPLQEAILPVCQDNIGAFILLCQAADNKYQFADHVSSEPKETSLRIEEGNSDSISINITDDGQAADNYNLAYTTIPGWTINLGPGTMSLAKDQTNVASLDITVPGGETPGIYTIWVNTTSQTNSRSNASTEITINVPWPDDVSAKLISPFTEMGDFPTGQYRIDGTVENMGEAPVPAFDSQLTISQLGVGSTVTLFDDDMESGMGNWIVEDHDLGYSSSTWQSVTTRSSSPTHSMWCGSGSGYTGNTCNSLQMADSIDLKGYTSATLQFMSYYSTEQYYDFLMVEASRDGGHSWDYLTRYHGSATSWQQRTLDMSDFLGYDDVLVRFRFTSDEYTDGTGFYLDDVVITAEDPSEAVVFGPTSISTPGILNIGQQETLSWDYAFTPGTYKATLETLHATDGNTANDINEVIFYINGSRALPEFDGVKAVANPNLGSNLEISWEPALLINEPITYHVYRFTSPPTENDVNTSSARWSGTALSYLDSGISKTTYYYVVRAEDSLGQSEYNMVTQTGEIFELNVDWWGPDIETGVPITETRYLRGVSNEANVNGLSAYSLGTANSNTEGNWAPGANVNIFLGMRVYKRTSAGAQTEISSGLVAEVSRTSTSSGFQTATWTPPRTALDTGDSIVIEVYGDTSTPPSTVRATFTSEALGPVMLEDNQWSVQYWTKRAGNNQGGTDWYWGTPTYDNHISGFQYSTFSPSDPLKHNTLNWTASSGVQSYNIYRSEFQTGPWDAAHLIDTVSGTTDTYVDLDRGMNDGTTWYYLVRAVDGLGIESTNSEAIMEPGILYPHYDIDMSGYSAGDWAFISFAAIPTYSTIETILDDTSHGDGLTLWDTVKWNDPQDATDPWKTYRIGSPTNDLLTLDNTMGLWLRLTVNMGDQMLTIAGDYSGSNINVNLYTGWNLVGYPSATQNAADAALAGTGADMIAVYQAAAPYVTDTTNLNSVTMSEGNAYWVHVGADTVWTVNP